MKWVFALTLLVITAMAIVNAEFVDSNDAIKPSMAIDSSGDLHVVYIDEDGNLKYAYKTGDGWHYDVVRYYEGYQVLPPSIAVSPSGSPLISYVIWNDSIDEWKLKYARIKSSWGSVYWGSETIDSGEFSLFPDVNPSIAADFSGHPHISYRDDANGSLKYAYYDGDWHVETIDTGDVGIYSSITVNPQGYVAIAYYDKTNGDLKYASTSPSGWTKYALDTGGDVGLYPSITIANQLIHISYYDKTNGDLKYYHTTPHGSEIETVDSDGDVGLFTSIAADSNGYPHISYYDYTNRNLKYAYKDAGGWHVETVDNVGNVGRYTSIALDSNGNPHICYHSAVHAIVDAVKCTAKQPTIVNLKGSLADSNGLPVMTASIRVKIKNVDGDVVHQETFNNAVENGDFDVMLGAKQELKLWEGTAYNLIIEVDVDSDTFNTADVTFGDNNPAGDVISFYP